MRWVHHGACAQLMVCSTWTQKGDKRTVFLFLKHQSVMFLQLHNADCKIRLSLTIKLVSVLRNLEA